MDIDMFYREKSTGDPLILLHGNGEDSSYFIHQIEYFSSKYKVIAIDTRGHGKTSRGTKAFTIAQFAENLNVLMKSLGIEEPHILGFSDGANIAMRFALKYPNKVMSLVLNGGNLNAKGVKRRVQIPIEIGYRLAKLFANKFSNVRHNMELLSLMVNEPNIEIEELENICTPTLIIVGNKDMIKEKHTENIADKIQGSHLSVIKGNHFVANKKPKEFNKVVEKFFMGIRK